MRWPGGRKSFRRRLAELRRPRGMPDRIERQRLLQRIGDRIEARLEIGGLDRLHQTEMPLRQGEPCIVRQAAEQLDAGALEGLLDHRQMPRARDAIEDHAGDADIVTKARASRGDGGRRLDLAFHVEHQHDRPAQHRRDIGRAAAPARAVEQAHHALR